MKKWLKITLIIVASILLLLVIVLSVAPHIAKGYVNRHGKELIGREIRVEKLRLNALSGRVRIYDLTVFEDDGTTAFFSFDTLDVSVKLRKLLANELYVRHITLAEPRVRVIQDGDRFNFSSLLEHFASEDTVPEQDTTPSDWTMKFYNIRLSHARLNYDDMVNHKGIHLPDINLRVPGFVLGGEESSEAGLNLGFDRGGRLNVDAHYDTQTGSYQLAVNLTDFAMQNLDAFLADMLNYRQLEGSVEAHLRAEGNVEQIMRSRIGGTVAVNGLDLQGESGRVAGFDALTVKVDSIVLDDNLFDIAEVKLSGLKATYAQWKNYSNIDRLLAVKEQESVTLASGVEEEPKPEPVDTAAPAPSKPMQLHVGALRIEDAALTYDDYSLPDTFHFPVTALNISADDLTTTGDNNAQLRATLPGGGHLMLRWNGDISAWKRHQELFLTIKGLDMRQLSPWTVAYTGQPVEDGIFGLTTRLRIDNSELDNKNKIDIYKAKVGDRRRDVEPEMKIPLKAALYILKDKDDKILIEMPVKGNVDNPEFNYMKVVWKTLGNLLVKVATSPARALGGALGISGDELEFMAMEPMQHGLTSEQYHILSDIATIVLSDSLVTVNLEQRMPAAQDENETRRYEMLNEQVRRYLAEQGVGEDRVTVRTGEPVADAKEKTGYAITSEIKIEE